MTRDTRVAESHGPAPADTPESSRVALRALFDAALDAIIVVDGRARVVDANPAAARLVGLPREELTGRSIADFSHPSVAGRAAERWRQFMETGVLVETTQLVRGDGTTVDVEYSGTANYLPDRHLWILRDVTERNRAVRQVQFQAELLDHVDAAVVAIDLEGHVTLWNSAAERLYGVPRDEAMGVVVSDLVVPEESRHQAAEIWRQVRAGSTWQGEFKVRRRGAEPLSAWVLNAPIPDERGGVAGYVGVAVDLTERIDAERQLEQNRALRRAITQSALDAVVAMDAEGRTVEWNPAAESTFGWTREEMLGEDLMARIAPPELLPRLREELAHYGQEGEAWLLNRREELEAMRADGSRIPVEISVIDTQLDDGSPIFIGYIRDITDRKQTEALLAVHAEQQKAVAEMGQRALASDSVDDVLRDAVSTVARMLDGRTGALLELDAERNEFILRVTTTTPQFEGARMPVTERLSAGYTLAAGEPVVVEDWEKETRFEQNEMLRELGSRSIANVIVGGEGGRPWGILGMESAQPRRFTTDDVNFMQSVANVVAGAIERHRVEDAIRHRAVHDSLTGLPNRTLLLDRLEHALAQVERRGTTVALIFVDLDQFKVVNDSLGHDSGDRLLRAVAQRLADTVRPDDTLARFAGDEFVVLCEGVGDAQDAIAVADRLMEAFSEPFDLGRREQFASVSMGIALPRRADQSAEDLIRDADAAMYRAKERGRARYELFDERMRVRTLIRMRMENDLRHAELGTDLVVHYQPLVSLAEGDVAGFEALARWRHPHRGEIPPAEFIPVAEESGLIVTIGRWVLEQAAQQAVRWRGQAGRAERPLTVGVNVSARQITQGRFADDVAEVLADTGLEPERLVIEITESLLMEQNDVTYEALHALHGLGVAVVLDDFGTGYSSLSYLDRFPIDALKIDRSFVGALDAGGSAAIVTAIVSMAHSLDMHVTAEGVETVEQLEHLRRLGVEYAQGFFFGRPAAAQAHDRLLAARLPITTDRP